jgi:predicted acyltransferase
VLVAGGYSAILLAVFHQVIEVWNRRRWAQVFVWVGANAITIYLANNLIDYERLATRFAGGDVRNFLDAHLARGAGDLLIATVALLLAIALAHFLYRRRIFLRL